MERTTLKYRLHVHNVVHEPEGCAGEVDESIFQGTVRDLERLFEVVTKDLKLKALGFKLSGSQLTYGVVESFSELPFGVTDVQGPASYSLVRKNGVNYFRHSSHSPKHYLRPPYALVLKVDPENRVTIQIPPDEDIALFGIKPCDLQAIKVLDGMLKDLDPIYTKKRENIKLVIVEECVEPSDVCFCGSIGSGPNVERDFDLSFARLNGRVLFKVGSDKGRDLANRLNLGKADESTIRVYKDAIERARARTRAIGAVGEVMNALKKSIADVDLWKELSSRCVGCANCNMVCPTCFCVEFYDEVDDEGNDVRGWKWIGCNSYVYGQVAGLHFRPEQYMRYRHFILHKFLFYPLQVGLVGCVGCGRCITWCPMAIDIRETVRRVIAKYAGGG